MKVAKGKMNIVFQDVWVKKETGDGIEWKLLSLELNIEKFMCFNTDEETIERKETLKTVWERLKYLEFK